MRTGSFIVKFGTVVSTHDDLDGRRIKVRLAQDRNSNDDKLPYSYPLLPKTINIMPKVGECVLVITGELDNKNSIRYYIGPVISQFQNLSKDEYSNGFGSAASLFPMTSSSPLGALSHYNETDGSFPNKEDVALIGRESEDIILKDGEINIRCGIREEAVSENKDLNGKVVFNKIDPSYIQLKHNANGITHGNDKDAKSLVNIVADKINLISHKDSNSFELTDNKKLITDKEQQNIIDNLHQLPHGDKLIEFLDLMRDTIISHIHPFHDMEAIKKNNIIELMSFDLEQILSKDVRIS
jgi:hypothetical protein